jgi:stage V sporulation protein SpoVS
MTTGARSELLATGQLGPVGADLLYQTVSAVARARNFPPPEGHAVWDRSAVEGVAHEVLAGPRGLKRLTDLMIRSTDEESFTRQLQGAVHNVLRDRGRATEVGALIRRITEVLNQSTKFRIATAGQRRWTLVDGQDTPSKVPQRTLELAAAGVGDVTVPRWSSASRRAPHADFASFERLLAAILVAAEGSVTAADLAQSCRARLDPAHIPLTVELDALEQIPVGYVESRTEDETLNRLVAHDFFSTLSDRERLILATSDQTVRDAAESIGLGHSQCGTLRKQLTSHLTSILLAEPDGEDIFREMLTYAQAWLAERTRRQDATS